MRYKNIHKATFLARPNRFIARVLLDGEEVTVHVKNTGRCRELLVPGCTVYLEKSDNPARKTAYDLVAVEKVAPDGTCRLINMDSQAPNKLFEEWTRSGQFVPGLTLLRPETTWGNSRFDFYWEAEGKGAPREPSEVGLVGRGGTAKRASPRARTGARDAKLVPTRGFVEVKGCTLEEGGWTYFPDAPTERGVKHLEELLRARQEGYEAAVCIVIQMAAVDGFSPNDRTHPAFGEALRRAAAGGVEVLAYACDVTPEEVRMTEPVPVKL